MYRMGWKIVYSNHQILYIYLYSELNLRIIKQPIIRIMPLTMKLVFLDK